MARDDLVVTGSRVKGVVHQRHKNCTRCGMPVIRDRNRADGLVLCADCPSDRWFIQRAGRTVTT